MSDGNARPWEQICLKELGELSTSSVDKKVEPSERRVSLINYMDVYRNDFIEPSMSLMPVTASASEIDRFQIKKYDVLFTPSSETPDDIGHAALILADMPHTLHSYHTVRFRQFSPPRVQGRFAGHIFKQRCFRGYVARNSTGSTRYTLSLGEFERAVISVPPAEEQVYIAQVLDTLDTQIRQTEALIAKLERIKQGLLTDLLTRGIDQNGELRPTPDQAPHLYKDSPVGRIPKEWDARKLCELAEKIIDGSHQTPTYTRSGVPFLRVTDIHSEFIDLAEVKFISQREHRQFIARCDPRKGDLLLSKNGTVGIAKIVDWDWEFSIFVSLALIRVREPQEIIPKFLETVLNSNIVRRQIEKRSKQGTVTNLHLEEIRDFDIPVPSEEEQKVIAQHANTYWSRLKVERHELEKLLMEKSGLIDDLLTGRVRVAPLLETEARATV